MFLTPMAGELPCLLGKEGLKQLDPFATFLGPTIVEPPELHEVALLALERAARPPAKSALVKLSEVGELDGKSVVWRAPVRKRGERIGNAVPYERLRFEDRSGSIYLGYTEPAAGGLTSGSPRTLASRPR